MSNLNEENTSTQETNIVDIIKPYFKKWYWYAVCVLLVLAMAFFYIKTTTPIYNVKTSILVKEDKKGPSGGEFAILQDLAGLSGLGAEGGVDNEVEILKSRKLMTDVVNSLHLTTNIYSKEGFSERELYKDTSPIIIQVISEKPNTDTPKERINLKIDGNNIELSSEELKTIKTAFNKTVSLPYANLMFLKNPKFNKLKTGELGELSFSYTAVEDAIIGYGKMLKADRINRDVTVVELGINHSNIDKAKDILDKLVAVYNQDAVDDKNYESKKTAEFIDERIELISKELGSVEDEKERFKKTNDITDIETEAKLTLESEAGARVKQIEIEAQLDLNNALINYVSKQGNAELLPAIGLENAEANSNIDAYNQLVLARNQKLENATPQNPIIIDLNRQISSMRESVLESLKKNKEGLEYAKSWYVGEQNKVQARMSKIPLQEKMYRNIERQQTIKETLYILLLQKREENAISLAITASKAKVVDYAYADPKPVAPRKMITLAGALLLGLLIPTGLIYLLLLLDNKIKGKKELEKLTVIPILAEIPKLERGADELVRQNDFTGMAEAFRILVTNLNFTLPVKEKGQVLYITSTIKGEGKTFISVNLALTLAKPGRRVIVIGADVRNPQLQRYDVSKKNTAGLSEFLHDDSVKLSNIIHKTPFNGDCDVIYSGTIPPNPTELLSNGRIEMLLHELEDLYDFIILDTAPLLLVADTVLISKFADATIYVARSQYTEKSLIEFANRTVRDKKITNASMVLNDVSKENLGYGNKYGYGYGAESHKGFFEKLKEKLGL
ncbi:MAG: polysaccharide biosynthesis tyrosine autokinase [Flavobacteriaceae bacterium]|jgi:capsular exopolysaccharide synthesis family protein|nr:polysaccharide biosynthesis tyrosine autokinase [Flavobacteriaceae bacterium]